MESIKNYLVASYPNRGITFVTGEGVNLITDTGEKYLDLGSNYGVSIFGYNYAPITKALEAQLHRLLVLHGSFGNDMRNEAANTLVTLCGGQFSKVYFSNSGAEAVEAALKFARLATGKSHFIAMTNAYHGKTLGALSATSGVKYREPFQPLLWNFTHVPLGDIDAAMNAITEDTAAVILEPVQGEGGIKLASKEYFAAIRKLCDEKNILLIVDEIQTGVGRTGTFLTCEYLDFCADILCLGKGLAGGIPVGATLVTEDIAKKVPMNIHTSTFGGNPLACAGILATLKEFENGKILEHVRNMGKYFLTQLQSLKHDSIVECRGIGLMIGLELKDNATPVLKALQKEKIIAIPAGSTIVRFLPPFFITEKDVDRTIGVLRKYFGEFKN